MTVRILSARIGRVNAVLENSLDIRTKTMHTLCIALSDIVQNSASQEAGFDVS